MLNEDVSDSDCFECQDYRDRELSEDENDDLTWQAAYSCMFREIAATPRRRR